MVLPVAATGLPLRKTWAALAIPHFKVLLDPCMIVVGEALKGLVIEGQADTLTVVDWLMDCAAQSLLVVTSV